MPRANARCNVDASTLRKRRVARHQAARVPWFILSRGEVCLNARMKSQCGFTWIELLAVITVIAVLALMAVPSMSDATMRKQVKEALALADVAKVGVQAAYVLGGALPADNEAAAVPAPDKIVGAFVKQVKVDQGAITLELGNNAHKGLHGKHVTVRPAIVPDEPRTPIAWLCHDVDVPKGMEVKGRDETDVPPEWLPVECRGPAKRK